MDLPSSTVPQLKDPETQIGESEDNTDLEALLGKSEDNKELEALIEKAKDNKDLEALLGKPKEDLEALLASSKDEDEERSATDGAMSEKKRRKMLKQMQNDPNMANFIKRMQENQGMFLSKETDPKARLQQRLNQSQLKRAGPKVQQSMKEKKDKKAKEAAEKAKAEAEVNAPAEEEQKQAEMAQAFKETVQTSFGQLTKQLKAQRDKLKKLQKKLGKVSFEKYLEAQKTISEATKETRADHLNQAKNVVELYLKQNPQQTEKQLDLEVISSSDEEDNNAPN